MPNKYYLRHDRTAVKPQMTMPEESHFGENDGRNTFFDFYGYNKAMTEWYDHLLSLPALDVDPDYLKRLSPGWFEGVERYKVYDVDFIYGWHIVSKKYYDKTHPDHRSVTIVAPQEAERGQEGEYDPYTKCREVLQELVYLKSIKDIPSFKDEYESRKPKAWADAKIFLGNNPKPATPQPVTGETKMFSREISKHLVMISRISDLDQMRRKVFDLISLIANHFIPMEEEQAASRPSDAVEFGDLIEDAVNAYFHQAEKELGRKDLGYIEERNWQKIKNDCQRFFTNPKSPNPNK